MDDRGQDRTASANVYEFDSVMTRGHNIYKNHMTHDIKVYLLFITQPNTSDLVMNKRTLKSIMRENTNRHKEYAVDNWLQPSPIKDAIFATYQARHRQYAHFS